MSAVTDSQSSDSASSWGFAQVSRVFASTGGFRQPHKFAQIFTEAARKMVENGQYELAASTVRAADACVCGSIGDEKLRAELSPVVLEVTSRILETNKLFSADGNPNVSVVTDMADIFYRMSLRKIGPKLSDQLARNFAAFISTMGDAGHAALVDGCVMDILNDAPDNIIAMAAQHIYPHASAG